MGETEKLMNIKRKIILVNKFKDMATKLKRFLDVFKFSLNDEEKKVLTNALDIIEMKTKNIEIELLNTGESFIS